MIETNAFGASIDTLIYLADEKNYTLVHPDPTGVDAFFIKNDYIYLKKQKSHDFVDQIIFYLLYLIERQLMMFC